jgi:RNA:NAD 2'-phosphotransferase (TPT1/KptA family)
MADRGTPGKPMSRNRIRDLDAIFAERLRPRARHHVHLYPDVKTATLVGARRGVPVIFGGSK